MEEMNNEVMEMNEVNEPEVVYDEAYESEGSGVGKALVVGAVLGGAALVAVGIKKGAGKLDGWMKKRLEKKGYKVEEPEVEHVEGEIMDSEE